MNDDEERELRLGFEKLEQALRAKGCRHAAVDTADACDALNDLDLLWSLKQPDNEFCITFIIKDHLAGSTKVSLHEASAAILFKASERVMRFTKLVMNAELEASANFKLATTRLQDACLYVVNP